MAIIIKLREKEYFAALNKLVDEIYQEAKEREWTWQELATRAGLATSTVYKLGQRETRFPRFLTVWQLARTVGGNLEFEVRKIRQKAVREG